MYIMRRALYKFTTTYGTCLHICQDQQSDGAKAFTEVAGDIDDVIFGITSDEAVFTEYKISGDAVVLFKNVCCSSVFYTIIY